MGELCFPLYQSPSSLSNDNVRQSCNSGLVAAFSNVLKEKKMHLDKQQKMSYNRLADEK